MSEDSIIILNTITHSIYGWGWSWGGFLAAFICAIVVIIFILGIRNKNNNNFLLSLIGISIALAITSIMFFRHGKVINTYETYEVMLNYSVRYLEFTDKFEVINQRGAIYEIKLKDIED